MVTVERYYVESVARNGDRFVDPVRSHAVAVVLAAQGAAHGDRCAILVSRSDGRGGWTEPRPEAGAP